MGSAHAGGEGSLTTCFAVVTFGAHRLLLQPAPPGSAPEEEDEPSVSRSGASQPFPWLACGHFTHIRVVFPVDKIIIVNKLKCSRMIKVEEMCVCVRARIVG